MAGRDSPRRATSFLARARKEAKNTPPSLRPLRCATGQTCVGALAGCAAELTARYALRSDNCGKSVYASMRASTRMLTPQAPRPRRSPRGLNSPTRAIAALGPARGTPFAGPSTAMARVVPLPSGRAEKRRARGGLAPQDASLRDLTCRSCLNEARSAQ